MDLQEWIDHLEKVPELAAQKFPKVIARGAVQIKLDWRARWMGHPHIKALPFAIGYDQYSGKTWSRAVIGPDKLKNQGPLGNLIEFEFGSPKSHPIPAGLPALLAEEPRLVNALADLAVEIITGPDR